MKFRISLGSPDASPQLDGIRSRVAAWLALSLGTPGLSRWLSQMSEMHDAIAKSSSLKIEGIFLFLCPLSLTSTAVDVRGSSELMIEKVTRHEQNRGGVPERCLVGRDSS